MPKKKKRVTAAERKKVIKYLGNRAESNFCRSRASKIQDAKDAGFTGPRAAIRKMENDPETKSLVREEMDKQGLTLKFTVAKHKQLMECKDPRYPSQDDNRVQMEATKHAYLLQESVPNPKLLIDKREERHYSVSIEAYRRAEEITGEKIIDVVPEEDEDIGFVEAL